jgi:endonuclease YncB( thermonuclease family)
MKKTVSTVLMLSVMGFAASVYAQALAPTPRGAPRTPVSRQVVVPGHDPIPAARTLQGPAAIIDGEKLRIDEADLRLFGIVPPQLSASFGPQARATLDTLANGQAVTCQVRDRDRDGRLLATCRNSAGLDMALELLKRGLAVTARGSIAGTELSAAYLAGEQAAQNAKIGLWSSLPPAPVSAIAAAPKPEPVAEKEDKPVVVAKPDMQNKIVADTLAAEQARIDADSWPIDNVGFFERYQILIAGMLMLATGLAIGAASWLQDRRDRNDDLKAVAAALRGELMAARSVCSGRAKSITGEAQDKETVWPRIRSTLYQAYVGRLGLLGAELARQVASIYGQSGDYAALYSPTGAGHEAPKKQALETLVKYIDAVLPKLAQIEQSGKVPVGNNYAPVANLQYSEPRYAPARAAKPVTAPQAAPIAEPVATENAVEETPVTVETPSAVTPTPAQNMAEKIANLSPVALWENVRGFMQGHRTAVEQVPVEPHPHTDGDYAAMIEADMIRYQYGENIETLDITPHKKQG